MIDCFAKAFAMPCLLLEIYYHSIIKQLQCLVYIFTAASVNFMPKWLKIVPFSYKILIVYRTFSISKWGIFCEISYLYRHQKKNSLRIGWYYKQLMKKWIGGNPLKFILFRVISYHIHTKMAKKYKFHIKNEKSYQPGCSAYLFTPIQHNQNDTMR